MKLLILLSLIVIFFSCNPLPSTHDEMPLNDTQTRCFRETDFFKSKLKKCDLSNADNYKGQGVICKLYDENYNYTDAELNVADICGANIDNLSCDDLSTTSKLDDIDACPTFKDKPMKSKKQICAENYFVFCQKQLDKCGETHLDEKCELAKYTKSNSVGKDAHTSFKMDKLLEYCESESNENADINDLDCIVAGDRVIEYDVCQTNPSLTDFRNACSWYE